MARPRIPLLTRLPKFLGVASLDELDEHQCWPWLGTLNGWLPIVVVNGRRASARRAIYQELMGVELDREQWLRWRCVHPTCVNPRHAQICFGPQAIGVLEAPPDPDEPPSLDEVMDLLETMGMPDAATAAAQLRLPIELVEAALAAF